MQILRFPTLCFASLVVMLSVSVPACADEAVPLNDYARLGQRLTATRPIVAVWVTVPSWSDSEGGLTVTLWDSPDRKRKLASERLTNIHDNARVELTLAKPLPAGAYYWEVADRTGTTRIGLYATQLAAPSADCAYFDGKPDPLRAFISGTTVQDYVRVETGRLCEVLTSDASLEDKVDACRSLASWGDARAVPVLAALLSDRRLSHMARYALQAIPGRASDDALRRAVPRLQGELLVGVVNSLGVRRDKGSVKLISGLLASPDAAVVAAAAAALGRIGTPTCAAVLEKEFARRAAGVRTEVEQACLQCAEVLAATGDRRTARTLYDRLRLEADSPAARRGALIGAIAVRGDTGALVALECLRSGDTEKRAAALWSVQRGLSGRSVTFTLCAALDRLDGPTRVSLIDALGARGDPSATPAVASQAAAGEQRVRISALRALGRLGAASAAAALVAHLRDADAEVAGAAGAALAALPRSEVEAAASSLLRSSSKSDQLHGVALASEASLASLAGELVRVARGRDPEVTVGALRAVRDLAGAAQFADVVGLLMSSAESAVVRACDETLVAICGRATDPTSMASIAVESLSISRTPQRLALLHVLGACGGPKALAAVVSELKHADLTVRKEAEAVLYAWRTVDAAPSILKLAREALPSGDAVLAVRALLRLASDPETPAAARLGICRDAAPLIRRDEEMRMLLSALAGIRSTEAARMIVPYLTRDSIKAEAALAFVGLAEQLPDGELDPVLLGALERVSGWSDMPELSRRASERAARFGAPRAVDSSE